MTAYDALHVELTCAACGAPLEPVNQAHPSTREAVVVYNCSACHHSWLLRLQLAQAARDPNSAARQGRYRNGPGGPACTGTTGCGCAHHRRPRRHERDEW